MAIGIRAILLAVAVLLFVIGVFSDESAVDLLLWGLAALAASFLVEALGLDRGVWTAPTSGTGTTGGSTGGPPA